MARYTALCAGLFLLGAIFTLQGMAFPVLMLYPLPVAWFWTAGNRGQALGLAGCAVLAALAGTASLEVGLLYGLIAGAGAVLALAALRYRRFGVCVAALTGYFSALFFAGMAWTWPALLRSTEIFLVARMQDIRDAAADGSVALAESSTRTLEVMQALVDNLVYVHFGIVFAFLLLMSTVAVVAYQRGTPRVRTVLEDRFSAMRPPEWLVWIVILAACGWFWDREWSQPWVRALSWNAAVGLGAVYWLNGLSIAVHSLNVLQVHWLWFLVMGLVSFQAYPLLCIVGLFDTWWSLRDRMARVAAARQSPDGGRPDDN
ncbi:MAG: DUF2232 domain-containing protein [Candidatus Hydrogenedentes bacterium]|nr:DUF2232 domain-containing protein [Candidatus Hydrogenedentota bacterium]